MVGEFFGGRKGVFLAEGSLELFLYLGTHLHAHLVLVNIAILVFADQTFLLLFFFGGLRYRRTHFFLSFGLEQQSLCYFFSLRVHFSGRKISFEMMLIGGDDLLHEEQVAVEINCQKQDGEQVVDIGFQEFLGLHTHSRVFIQLLCDETVFGGNCKIAHRKVKQLPKDIASIEEGFVVFVIGPVLQRHHINDFADRIVADVFLQCEAYLLHYFVLIPFSDPPSCHTHVAADQTYLNFLTQQTHFPEDPSQIHYFCLLPSLFAGSQSQVILLQVSEETGSKLEDAFASLECGLPALGLRIDGAELEVILDQLHLLLEGQPKEGVFSLLIWRLFAVHGGIGRRRLQGVEMCLEVKDEPLQVLGCSGQICFLVIAAGFVMQGGHYDIAVDGFPATGSILQNTLCL